MPAVLITGAGRGIGRATALRLAHTGWEVHAGVRRPEDGDALARQAPAGRIVPALLDVTESAQVAALDASLPARLDAVVNNAGIVVDGPLEPLALDDLRRQLEVNVVGQLAVTQAVLPRLRASRGRVLFVSSVSGRVATPLMGAYVASKYALEGLADALRIELRPWGVRVVVIEPNSTDTDVWRSALTTLESTEAALTAEQRALYHRHFTGARRMTALIQKRTMEVDVVAATIERALTARRPRARYPVGALARAQIAVATTTPAPVMDAALAGLTGTPRRA